MIFGEVDVSLVMPWSDPLLPSKASQQQQRELLAIKDVIAVRADHRRQVESSDDAWQLAELEAVLVVNVFHDHVVVELTHFDMKTSKTEQD